MYIKTTPTLALLTKHEWEPLFPFCQQSCQVRSPQAVSQFRWDPMYCLLCLTRNHNTPREEMRVYGQRMNDYGHCLQEKIIPYDAWTQCSLDGKLSQQPQRLFNNRQKHRQELKSQIFRDRSEKKKDWSEIRACTQPDGHWPRNLTKIDFNRVVQNWEINTTQILVVQQRSSVQRKIFWDPSLATYFVF